MFDPANELAKAHRHVTEAEARVRRQAQLVRHLAEHGHNVALATKVLRTMRASLRLLREHLASLEERERARTRTPQDESLRI